MEEWQLSDTGLIIVAVLVIGIAITIFISIRVLATKKTRLGRICRWFWNTSFKFAAFMPFCGWMTRFMIADTEKEKREKKHWVEVGDENDQWVAERVVEAGERQKAENEALRAQAEQEALARKELEEDLQAQTYRKYGTRDVHLNRDGSYVKLGNGEFVPVEEYKKSLR